MGGVNPSDGSHKVGVLYMWMCSLQEDAGNFVLLLGGAGGRCQGKCPLALLALGRITAGT